MNQQTQLEQLFRESADDLSRYFLRRHAGDGIEDLVQETFLQWAKVSLTGRHMDCPRGYLFGIARRLSQAAWTRREERNHKVLPFDEAVAEVAATTAVSDDRAEAARETILSLEPIQREILDLRFSQSLSYTEIAEALGIPVGTVRSRLHHAVIEVRHRLATEPS